MALGRAPGARLTLGDGTECVVVRGDAVPRRFLQAKKKLGYDRPGDLTAVVISTYKEGKGWTFHDDPPYDPWQRGGFYLDAATREAEIYLDENEYHPSRCAICVPLVCMEPECNEYGEVVP